MERIKKQTKQFVTNSYTAGGEGGRRAGNYLKPTNVNQSDLRFKLQNKNTKRIFSPRFESMPAPAAVLIHMQKRGREGGRLRFLLGRLNDQQLPLPLAL